jgi:imidazolonepropionase-like amidohydrolase
MVRAGMSDIEALRSATCIAASVLGIPELGSLKNKAFADLVILRKNPLDDIGSIKEVAAVIRNGHLLFKSSSKS